MKDRKNFKAAPDRPPFEVRIEKISPGGEGIAKTPLKDPSRSFVIFVPYTAPGDRIRIRLNDVRDRFARAEALEIIEKGPGRIEAPCPYYFSVGKNSWCGGCNLQHLNYEAQKSEKGKAFAETIEKISGLRGLSVLPVMGEGSNQWRFRNKIQIPIGAVRGQAVAGFYSPQSHAIVPISDCLIQPEAMMQVVASVREHLDRWGIVPYSEETRRGWLRHLYIRHEAASGDMILVFVSANEFFPKKKEWIELLSRKFPKVIGICQNVNPARTNVILGRKWSMVWGKGHLMEKLRSLGAGGSDLRLKVSAGSFFQVNTAMAERLYAVTRDFLVAEPSRCDRSLIDLYCGVGGIALSCASSFAQVIGADEVPASIEDARENAKINRVSNVKFHCMDARQFLRQARTKFQVENLAAIVVDPPRSGCAPEVLGEILKLRPQTIVYVSCEPATLARDLKILAGGGFKIRKLQPVDLFPQSAHIESVALLSL